MSRQRQAKKEMFDQEKKNGFGGIIAAVLVVAVLAIGGGYFFLFQGASDGHVMVNSNNGEVRLDINEISDGNAHYFKYASDTGDISFFVIKSVDGVMRAAFDACDVCYREKKGYRQEATSMVCNNCGMQFRSDLINVVKGGCNPAPLNRRIEGKQLVINDSDILQGAKYFGG